MKNAFIAVLIFAFASVAFAQEEAPLDPAYQVMNPPQVSENSVWGELLEVLLTEKVPVQTVIAKQSPVKSQVERGTCSIFSATALLESRLLERGQFADVDLSEEWLQYLISQETSTAGSNSPRNFSALFANGQPSEATFPYDGSNWTDVFFDKAQDRCGHLVSDEYKLGSCLVSHRDPALLNLHNDWLTDFNSAYYDLEFYFARKEARLNKAHFFGPKARYENMWTTNGIKKALDAGIPLTMEVSFYYGAWNHRVTEELGIHRDMALWSQGIVTYPESGTMDSMKSPQKAAGHSVVIVGYDNDRVIEYTTNMADGSMKTFKRKGVYYFKNSWGTQSFGATFTIENQNYPGYGMITQDYANQYGTFYSLFLN
jgi:hypothetical protein